MWSMQFIIYIDVATKTNTDSAILITYASLDRLYPETENILSTDTQYKYPY